MHSMNEKIKAHARLIDELKETRMTIKEDKHNRRELEKKLRAIEVDNGCLLNQQASLESFVDKYMPLKLQHQMNETLLDCFDKKAKIRFIELNTVMTDALRDEVLKDTGHPKLRAKCLDLITKMRLEA